MTTPKDTVYLNSDQCRILLGSANPFSGPGPWPMVKGEWPCESRGDWVETVFISLLPTDRADIIIAGGRGFNDYRLLCESCDHFITERVTTENITIISGTAPGADRLGERYAAQRGYKVHRCPADWGNLEGLSPSQIGYRRDGSRYNKAAGMIRNEQMARLATHAVLFWDGASAGTKGMKNICLSMGLPHKVVRYGAGAVPQQPSLFEESA